MFHWHKLGNIFSPENNYPWMVSHAANPFPVRISDQLLRIYFTTRDKNNRSHVAYIDVDPDNQFKLLGTSNTPVVVPGSPGYFDDSGAAMGCYLEHDGKKSIYYLGWNLKVTVPWQNSIGLAVARPPLDDFVKYGQAPILDRSNEDPFSISYPHIIVENGKYKMWYGSNLSWGPTQDEMDHVIKYAESDDGIHWVRTNHVCIGLEHPKEYAITKPFVIKSEGLYRMWYSYRANASITTYRIGYATSENGTHWTRKDHLAGIDVAESGWDNEMICYASVFSHKGSSYMLYNGNGYGKTGFGLAVGKQKTD